jgi:DNA helicase-2/ATP-dependent DNA helicase PcrA
MDTGYGGYRGGRFGASGHSGGPYGASRFDKAEPFAGNYNTPGWKRAQANKTDAARRQLGHPLRPRRRTHRLRRADSGPRGSTIEGELVAKSTGTTSAFSVGDRVFHLKFGNGNIASIDGNKLTIDFDKAGQKRVLDGFVERVG